MEKILLINNDYSILNQVSGLLEKAGYQIYLAQDGKKGLELAVLLLPSLIISDIVLPGLDGFELLKKLNLNNETTTIPFIFLTSKTKPEYIYKAMILGADSYIIKPFRAKELLFVIENKLNKVKKIKSEILKKDNKKDSSTATNNSLKLTESILIDIDNSPHLVKISTIEYIIAQGDYSEVYIIGNGKATVRKPIKCWEVALPVECFVRIHRSTIININAIENIDKWYQRAYKIKMMYSKMSFITSQRYTVKIKSRLKV